MGSQCEERDLTIKYSSVDLVDSRTYFLCMGLDRELPINTWDNTSCSKFPAKIPSDLALGSFGFSFHGEDGNVGYFTRSVSLELY
jgi:hypothetical protein